MIQTTVKCASIDLFKICVSFIQYHSQLEVWSSLHVVHGRKPTSLLLLQHFSISISFCFRWTFWFFYGTFLWILGTVIACPWLLTMSWKGLRELIFRKDSKRQPNAEARVCWSLLLNTFTDTCFTAERNIHKQLHWQMTLLIWSIHLMDCPSHGFLTALLDYIKKGSKWFILHYWKRCLIGVKCITLVEVGLLVSDEHKQVVWWHATWCYFNDTNL